MCAKKQEKDKLYKGFIPKKEADLERGRRELAQYFRDVWHDEIQAMEIEEAVTRDDYHDKLGEAIKRRVIREFPL